MSFLRKWKTACNLLLRSSEASKIMYVRDKDNLILSANEFSEELYPQSELLKKNAIKQADVQ